MFFVQLYECVSEYSLLSFFILVGSFPLKSFCLKCKWYTTGIHFSLSLSLYLTIATLLTGLLVSFFIFSMLTSTRKLSDCVKFSFITGSFSSQSAGSYIVQLQISPNIAQLFSVMPDSFLKLDHRKPNVGLTVML